MTQPNGTHEGVLRSVSLITRIENVEIDPSADNIASLETGRVYGVVTFESGCQVLSW